MDEVDQFAVAAFCLLLVLVSAACGYLIGQDNKEREIREAFEVMEEQNPEDHPVAKCMKEHFEKTVIRPPTK